VAICLRRRLIQGELVSDDDFDVFVEDRPIGRIWFEPVSSGQWHWILSERIEANTGGQADTRLEAVQGICSAYGKSVFTVGDIPNVPAFRELP
jgi:hypothetical protein